MSYHFQVSWIRHSDSGLLAVNDFVYTTSHRIKVFHRQGSPEWKLSINPVELSDAGLYQCQVSTTPHTSHFIALNVVGEPYPNLDPPFVSGHQPYRKNAVRYGRTVLRTPHSSCILTRERFRDSLSVFFPRNHSTKSDQFFLKWQL